MFKRYQQYKETKQYNKEMKRLRKQQAAKQKLRLLIILGAVSVGVLLVFAGMEMATPPEASSPAVSASQEKPEDIQEEQQVTSEIERFAYVVTKPLDQLTSEDLEFVEEMADDPCYEDNVSLPQEKMIDAITACKLPQ